MYDDAMTSCIIRIKKYFTILITSSVGYKLIEAINKRLNI